MTPARAALALAICLMLVAAASPADRAAAPTGEISLSGAGSTFAAPLYKQWITDYRRVQPKVSVAYAAVGSGEGIHRFIAGSVDFGASDVALSDREAAAVRGGAVMIPSTAGMVVLAYNVPGLRGALKLTREVYPAIFSGEIKLWNDPRIAGANPGLALPHRNIVIVARIDSSGTTYALSNHLATIDPTWRARGHDVGKEIEWPPPWAMLARGNEGVAARIKISEGSIGYVEYGFAKRLGLPMAVLQNRSGSFIAPTEAAGRQGLAEASTKTLAELNQSIADPAGAGAYPIVTFSWIFLYRHYAHPGKGAAVSDFVAWGLSNDQSFGSELGYLPLPSDVAAAGKQALRSVGR
jgi:phosphate transport system substrate-binding protein